MRGGGGGEARGEGRGSERRGKNSETDFSWKGEAEIFLMIFVNREKAKKRNSM